MKLKTVFTISILMFVLCIGAVSASEDFNSDNTNSSASIITDCENDEIAISDEDLNQHSISENNENSLEQSVQNTEDLEARNKGTFIDVTDAYIYLNDFRTKEGVWYWNSDDTTKTVFNTNSENTLEPLLRSTELEKAAKIRAQEIVKLFEHVRPDGSDCFTAYPDGLWAYGENIASGYTTCKSVTVAWEENNYMYAGQGHRRNMLEPYFNCVGIAAFKINGVIYWVQAFGTYHPIPNSTTNLVKPTDSKKLIVSAPAVTAYYKAKKYFKVTIKKSGKVVKNLKLKVKVYTGNKYKTYTIKTNKNGVAKLSTKKFKIGSHKVKISSKNSKYKISKNSKIVIKKKISYKTFKSNGYKWKIKTSTWKKMKQQAIKWREHFKKVGSINPGFSNAVTVKVTKNGHTDKVIAMAVKNANNKMRCEIRGMTSTGYIRVQCWL